MLMAADETAFCRAAHVVSLSLDIGRPRFNFTSLNRPRCCSRQCLLWSALRTQLRHCARSEKGRVGDGRGSFGHSATLRFPSHRVTGGGRPPPVPTDRGVRISRTTLFDSWFTALTAICSSFVSMVS